MANRLYIDDFQVFGNNIIGVRTLEELDRQGIVWVDHGWICKRQKITDIHALMNAINEDILEDLKRSVGRVYDVEKEKFVNVDFGRLKDSDLCCDDIINPIKYGLYKDDCGTIRKNSWSWLYLSLEEKKAFIPTLLYMHIKDKCKWETDENGQERLVIKPTKHIWVEMY